MRALVRAANVPVTSTLMGLGAYPGSDPQSLGMLGMHGTYEANMAMHETDLIFALGARFDDRVPTTQTNSRRKPPLCIWMWTPLRWIKSYVPTLPWWVMQVGH